MKPVMKGAFLLLLVNADPCHTITNIESERLSNTEFGTSGAVGLTLDGRKGSSDKIAGGLELKLIHTSPKDQWITLLNRDYAEVDNEINTDKTFLHIQYLTVDTPNWGHEVFTQYEDDAFRSFASTWLLGGGMRYTLTPTSPNRAHVLGFGAFYEDEDYLGEGHRNDEHIVRLNFYWAFRRIFSGNAEYTSTFYFQPSVRNLSDEKGLWQNAITLGVTAKVSLRVRWDVAHDTDSPESVVATETAYKTVLIYEF